MMNNPEFIDQLRKKDDASFSRLFMATKETIYNTALHLLQNESEAMDVMQEVYVEVYLSVDQFKGKSNLSTWMYRICVNKSMESLRREKRRKIFLRFGGAENEMSKAAEWVHPGVLAEQKDNARKLYAAITKLKAKEQISFTLYHIQGLPQKQIAEIMEQSVAAVETQIFRAKQKLSHWLIDQKE
jgi:RNA polymerase sigma-70 factor (ECF subfamily)